MFTNRKKKHFTDMIASADTVIWETEFKKFCTMQERELTRRQYDAVQGILAHLNSAPPDLITEEHKLRVQEAEKNLKDLTAQMQTYDGVINGSAPSPELPNGSHGLDNTLKEWVLKREYMKSFVKTNC